MAPRPPDVRWLPTASCAQVPAKECLAAPGCLVRINNSEADTHNHISNDAGNNSLRRITGRPQHRSSCVS